MVKRFDVVVFDVDGTLLDTTEGMIASVEYTVNKFGLEPLTETEIKKFIGPPIQDSFANRYGLEGDKLQELADCFRQRYKDVDLMKAQPYDGIYDVFEWILDQGMKPAVATYKRQDYAKAILEHFHFDKYTEILYGSDFEGKLKKQDIIKKCLVDCGLVDYGRAVMIGDSANDAIGAEKIGTEFIGVTYGFGFESKSDIFRYGAWGAESPIEIIDLLRGNE